MVSPNIQSHRDKTENLADLCKKYANVEDTRIQGYLAKYLAIMASAYIEICVKEVLGIYCKARSHPIITEFVQSTVAWENSLDCRKIEFILARFDRRVWETLNADLSPEARSAIDSLKALRDQIAHGKDNGTGYLVISRYFDAIVDFPERLTNALEAV